VKTDRLQGYRWRASDVVKSEKSRGGGREGWREDVREDDGVLL